MANDNRWYGNHKVPDHFTKGASATRRDPGPYEAIVMSATDPTRSGRLLVYISDLGGDIEDDSFWIPVSYASPFFGVTGKNLRTPSSANTYEASPHSYGFWFTQPDVGNVVLVTFANGDFNRGYWFACVVPEMNHQMVPGIAADPAAKDVPAGTETAAPTVEFNLNDPTLRPQWSSFTKIPKPVHKNQYDILLAQGLDRDGVRGVITSSSQRETPSTVFGFSTPGRGSEQKDPDTGSPRYRLGGHQFVLDDGDKDGKNRLMRLRTAGGHQIMMNDTEDVLYISNSTGTVWLEFTGEGQMMLYADQDISIRTKGAMNLHADTDLNLFAGNKINMVAINGITQQSDKIVQRAATDLTLFGGKVGVASAGALNLSAAAGGSFGAGGDLIFSSDGKIKLNSGAAPKVPEPKALTLTQFPDAAMKGNRWQKVDNAVQSIVTKLPHHEPFHGTTAAKLNTVAEIKGAAPKTELPSTPSLNANVAAAAAGGATLTSLADQATAAVQKAVQLVPTVIETSCGSLIVPLPSGQSKPDKSADAAGTQLGINEAEKLPVTKTCPPTKLLEQPQPRTGCGTLNILQTKALLAQIGFSESSFSYGAINQLGYVGKYQFGAQALEDIGYLKKGTYAAYKNAGVNSPVNWTGKDGIKSLEDFFASPTAQETIMYNNTVSNYNRLIKNGGLFVDDSPCVVAGMLAVAHLLGAGGAKKWRYEGGLQDANGTTGGTYFNRGRFAVSVLAPPTITS